MPETAVEYQISSQSQAKGHANSERARWSSNTKLAEIQLEMHRIAMDDSLKPQQRTAAANAFVNLEERRRLNLGKANPAPVKSEPKRRSRQASTGPASEPTQASVAVSTTTPKP